MFDYLIVGAGVYGATFARIMAENGKTCLVIDKREHIGGNCRDYIEANIHVHQYGAHIFHTNNDDVWKFVNKFSNFTQYQNNVKAMSYGKIYSLPFNMNTFQQLFGVVTPQQAKDVIAEEIEKVRVDNPSNLEEQAQNLVGQTVYAILIKDYTEKQWGKSCTELSPSIIKRLPVRFTFDNNYFNDKYQGLPVDGYSIMIQNMLKHDNITVLCSIDYYNIENWRSLAKKLIFTGQIDKFFDYTFGELEWRTLNFETVVYNTDNVQGCPVMNFCDKKVDFTRRIEHKHFLKDKSNVSIVTFETPKTYEKGDEPYYPIDNDRNNEMYAKYVEYAKSHCPDVRFGGRLGLYKYLDMDKVILQAMIDAKEDMKNE